MARSRSRVPAAARAILLLLAFLLAACASPVVRPCDGFALPRPSPGNRQRRRPRALQSTTALGGQLRGGGGGGCASSSPISGGLVKAISLGWQARVAADPNFLAKSVTEVVLAAGTQLVAEINRRGAAGCLTEIDFVVAGVLTAIAGKYYSSWRVAPTARPGHAGGDKVAVASASVDQDGTATAMAAAVSTSNGGTDSGDGDDGGGGFWSTRVPTNAFQPYHLDGNTRPTPLERAAALVAPIPALFRAGIVASAIGYGLTSVLINLRTLLLPDYVAKTVSINIVHACLYTGAFMAVVSNIRYQLLQGIIEPRIVDRVFRRWPTVRAGVTFAVRLANGLLGSLIAIAGMKRLGLQKLKS